MTLARNPPCRVSSLVSFYTQQLRSNSFYPRLLNSKDTLKTVWCPSNSIIAFIYFAQHKSFHSRKFETIVFEACSTWCTGNVIFRYHWEKPYIKVLPSLSRHNLTDNWGEHARKCFITACHSNYLGQSMHSNEHYILSWSIAMMHEQIPETVFGLSYYF